MRAAGGRVAQLIKMPVLMSQPVTLGRGGGGGGNERGRGAWFEVGFTQTLLQSQPDLANPTAHVRQALTLCPPPPLCLEIHTHTHLNRCRL